MLLCFTNGELILQQWWTKERARERTISIKEWKNNEKGEFSFVELYYIFKINRNLFLDKSSSSWIIHKCTTKTKLFIFSCFLFFLHSTKRKEIHLKRRILILINKAFSIKLFRFIFEESNLGNKTKTIFFWHFWHCKTTAITLNSFLHHKCNIKGLFNLKFTWKRPQWSILFLFYFFFVTFRDDNEFFPSF